MAAVLVVALVAASLVLRTGALGAGYWIDEGIAVGIASHELAEIPSLLRQDGSPPLYYLLLHAWMGLAGSGEAATRSLSLLFALLAVPAAWWAGAAAFDRRAGALAAAGAAGCPFLTYYAQEARMYSLVALLSVVAAGAFVLAFLRCRRRHLATLAAALVLLLYTHTWGVFLVAGLAVAWLVLWRRGLVAGRDGALVGVAVAALYAPWVPSLAFQALHTAAPWAERPSPLLLLAIPGALFGYVAAPFLVLAAAVLRRRADEGVRALVLAAAAAAMLAWACAQAQPNWSPRYLAVLLGPALLGLARLLSRGTGATAAALGVVAAIWLLSGPPPAKSNVRAVAGRVGAGVRPGDFVVSTQPEQVPVLDRYLPPGVRYLTPLGRARDPGVTDWRDALPRLRAARPERALLPVVRALAPGRRVLLVTPVPRRRSRAPWPCEVRARTREWRAALRADPRLRPLRRTPRPDPTRFRSAVRAELFEVRPTNEAGRGRRGRSAGWSPAARRLVGMAFQRAFDGSDPLRAEPVTRLGGTEEERRALRSGRMASGTLACPVCDAPVSPGDGHVSPADRVGCPFCGHAAPVRDFLSLEPPTRPARVAVRVVQRRP